MFLVRQPIFHPGFNVPEVTTDVTVEENPPVCLGVDAHAGSVVIVNWATGIEPGRAVPVVVPRGADFLQE